MHHFILGAVVGSVASFWIPTLWTINAFVIVLTLLLVFAHLQQKQGSITSFHYFYWGVLLAVLNIIYQYTTYNNQSNQVPLNGTEVRAEVTINSVIPPLTDSNETIRFIAIVQSQIDGVLVSSVNAQLSASKMLLSEAEWAAIQALKSGNRMVAVLKLKRIVGNENRYGFNFKTWSLINRVHTQGYILRIESITPYTTSPTQRHFDKVIELTQSAPQQGLLVALMTGSKKLVSDEEYQLLKRSGVAHLFAISGLHVGMVYSFFYLLLSFLRRHVSVFSPAMVQVLCLTLVWLFVYLVSFQTSAVRAAIMLSIWVAMQSLYCHFNKYHLLGVVIFLSMLWNPFFLLEPAWLLSIGAVAIILCYVSFVPNQFLSEGKFLSGVGRKSKMAMNYLIHLVLLQLFIGFMMSPIVLLLFGGVSLSGLWNNIFIIPLFSLVVMPSIIIAMTMQTIEPTIAEDILVQIGSILEFIVSTISVNGNLQIWLFGAPQITFVLALLLIMLLLRKTQALIISSIAIMCLSFANHVLPIDHWKLSLLDVGQGQSVLITAGNNALIYDLGPVYRSGSNATNTVVLPNLIATGITKPSVLISHLDADHRGALHELDTLNEWQLVSCNVGRYVWGDGEVYIHWPSPNYEKVLSKNDSSCVISMTINNNSIFLPGDITEKVESKLTNQKWQLDTEYRVLISAHHGSFYSNSYGFLEKVNPSIVLHSAGVRNRFGFPVDEVVERIEHVNANQFSTLKEGQIDITLSNYTSPTINGQLNNWTPFWKRQNPFSFAAEIR